MEVSGIKLVFEIPSKTNLDDVIKKVKEHLKGKINTNVNLIWTKTHIDSVLSQIRQDLKNKPLSIEIKPYFNIGALNTQLQSVQKKIDEVGKVAEQKAKTAVGTDGFDIYNPQLNDLKKEIDLIGKAIDEYGQLIKVIKKLNAEKEPTSIAETYRSKSGIETTVYKREGQETSYKEVTNLEKIAKEKDRIRKEDLKRQEETDRAILQTISNRNKLEKELEEQQAKHINKAQEIKYKEQQTEVKNLYDREKQLELFRKQSVIDMTRLEKTSAGRYDVAKLEAYKKSVASLNKDTKDLPHRINLLNKEMGNIKANAMKEAANASMALGEGIATAMKKVGMWAIATGGVYGVINALQQMWVQIVEIDKQFTELSKVLSNDTNWDTLFRDSAISANYFARSLSEVVDAEIEFGKLFAE
jgi:DNA repair exonuclease SbcCD ATPase subunit